MSDDNEDGKNTISDAEVLAIARRLVLADKDIAEATVKASAARGVKRGILKEAENAGANMEALKLFVDLRKLEEDDRLDLTEELSRYCAAAGTRLWRPGMIETAEQVDLFEDPPKALQEGRQALREAQIYSDGYNSRIAGGARDQNRQVAGSADYQQWDRGWLDAEHDQKVAGKPSLEAVATASTVRKPRKTKAVEDFADAETAGSA